MVPVISHPPHQVLLPMTMTPGIDNLVNHVFFRAVFCDDSAWVSEFMVWEQGGVVRDERFQEVGMETWKGLRIVGEA